MFPDSAARLRRSSEELRKQTTLPDGNDPQARAALAESTGWYVTEATLPPLEVPLSAIVGDEDPYLPNVQKLVELRPATNLLLLPGEDHGSVLTSPRFLSVLEESLRAARQH